MNYKGLVLSELKEEEVLFFVRIHGKRGIFGVYYPEIFLREFKQINQFRTISEYKVGDVYIDIEGQEITTITPNDFATFEKTLDIEDIIVRCRGLREISYHEARQLIWKTGKFFIDYFSKTPSLKLIVSLAVDNYVLDVMVRIAEYFGVKTIHLIGLFIPGYMRIVDRNGMGIAVRGVAEEEINDAYERLVNKKPSHFAIDKKKALKNAFRDYISYHYRFIVRYVWGYKINGVLSYEHRFAKYLQGFNRLSKLFVTHFFDSASKIDNNPANSIFIALHYHPEATVDYWADRKECADYLNSLVEIISFFKDKNIKVVLKEHPNYYLRRSRYFYKTLKSFDNVLLLDPYIPSQYLLEKIDNVCVHTGSVGVEALMVNKKVYTVSENYYTFSRIPRLNSFGDMQYVYYTTEEKKELLNRILQSTIKL